MSLDKAAGAAFVATVAILASSAVEQVGAAEFNVLGYGAICDDPTTDSTPSFQAALDAAANVNGGTVLVPRCRFWFNGNLVMGNGVALVGSGVGPYDPYWYPSAFTQGPTLLPRSSTAGGSAFIRINGTNSAVQDLLFFYPDQVGSTALEPDVYPPTLLVLAPSKITGCTFSNSYIAIQVMTGRVFLEKLHIGGFKNDIIVDNAGDLVRISQVTASTFWHYEGIPPQPIDMWALYNGTGITSYKADSLSIHDLNVHFRNVGIAFLDSPAVYGGATYGKGSDIDIDAVRYGVVAKALNLNAGFHFTNLSIGPEVHGVHMIWLQEGGLSPNTPRIVVNGGSTRSTWQKTLRVDAGTLSVRDIVGLNPIGRLPAFGLRPPPVPNSGDVYVSNLPAEGRVMITGGSVSDVLIGGKSTGLTSGMFLVSPGESITVVYSSPPTWQWFLN